MYKIIYKNDDLEAAEIHNSILSIRLEPNGLYFSLVDPNNIMLCEATVESDGLEPNLHQAFAELSLLHRQFHNVNILNVTDKFALVPAELYMPENSANYFDQVASGELAEIDCGNGVMLLMYIDSVVAQALRAVLGDNPHTYTHPVAQTIFNRESDINTIYVKSFDTVSFVLLYNQADLRFAEAFPVADFESLLFVVNRAIVAHKIGKFEHVCNDVEMATRFSSYYNDVLCE